MAPQKTAQYGAQQKSPIWRARKNGIQGSSSSSAKLKRCLARLETIGKLLRTREAQLQGSLKASVKNGGNQTRAVATSGSKLNPIAAHPVPRAAEWK
jgi:hypothetical protein